VEGKTGGEVVGLVYQGGGLRERSAHAFNVEEDNSVVAPTKGISLKMCPAKFLQISGF
jgi:hypothetical protein